MGVTEATLEELDVHVTTRPGPILLLLASRSVAVKTRPSFLPIAGGFEGEMATEATGTLPFGTGWPATVTVASPDFPATFAETRVVPGAAPVTTPSVETVAMAAFSTDQKMSGSASVSPAAFCTTTRSVRWSPIEIDDAGGDTATVATSTGGTSFMSDALHAATTSIAPQTTPRRTAFSLIAGAERRQEPVLTLADCSVST